MDFQFIEQFSANSNVRRVKFAKNNVVTALSESAVLVFDIKSTALLFEIQLPQPVQDYFLSSNFLYYSSRINTVVMDITTKEELCRVVRGEMFALQDRLFIVTPTALVLYSESRMQQLKVFDYGVSSTAMSGDQKIIVVSSSKLHIYDTASLKCREIDIMTRVLGVSDKFIVGKADDIQVYDLTKGTTPVYQFKEEDPIRCEIMEGVIYYLLPTCLKMIDIILKRNTFTISTNSSPDDLLVRSQAVYVMCQLKMYGYQIPFTKRDQPAKQPQLAVNHPQTTLVEDDLYNSYIQDNSFQINGILTNMIQQHSKLVLNLTNRNKAVAAIHKWYCQKNTRAAIVALERQEDICVIYDAFKFIRDSIQTIPQQELPTLVKISGRLIGGRYSSHVSCGIQLVNLTTRLVGNCTSAIATQMKKQLSEIKKSPRVEKILKMNVTEERRQLYEDVYQMSFNINKVLNSN